jgi:hypothetical protein
LFSTSLGFQDNPEIFLKRMSRETIDKIYRKGTPQTPNGRAINQTTINARKAGVSPNTLLDRWIIS